MSTAFRQIAGPGEIFLDHIAHWVADIAGAAAAMERLGFLLTPYTEHTNSTAPGEPILPAGSANHCIMLREGYLEILTQTGDTAIGRELRAGIGRYTGVHLIAFNCADAEAQRERLLGEGFDQRPVVDLRRTVETGDGGSGSLRFTVIRPVPGTMAEGRIQFLSHDTPGLLWQERWMEHPNAAEQLGEVVICVADPDEAAGRYRRYLGREPLRIDGGWLIPCDRGRLALLGRAKLEASLPGVEIPGLPYIAGYVIQCRDIDACRVCLKRNQIVYRELTDDVVAVTAPAALGGSLLFTGGSGAMPWGR
ncbi:MAG: VOC family protein [Alphaproteobacteria bacterium]